MVMELRQELIEYRTKLADSTNYRRVPVYAKALVIENLDRLIATEHGPVLPDDVWLFQARCGTVSL